MTAVDAMKKAVDEWWEQSFRTLLHLGIETKQINHVYMPDHLKKFCQVIHRLKHLVFDVKTGEWEYEGF